jgi:hypothetical protein
MDLAGQLKQAGLLVGPVRLAAVMECLALNDVRVITDLAGLGPDDLDEADCFTREELSR